MPRLIAETADPHGRRGLAPDEPPVTTLTSSPCRPSDNPFASHRIDTLGYRAQGTTCDELLAKLERLRWRAAVIGPEGSGKTTLLEALSRQTEGSVLVRLGGGKLDPRASARRQLPQPITPRHTVFVDAAERLGLPGWWWLRHAVRNSRGLVVTLHSPGRLPTLVQCHTSTPLLRELVHELAPEDADALEPRLEALFHRHGGNLRLCLGELYDLYAGRHAVVEKELGARS
jgi:hypothetical protein